MRNPFRTQTQTEKIETALGIPPQNPKVHKAISAIMHALLYISIFLAGYIVAKVQTLVTSI